MNNKSQETTINASIVETAFNEERILNLLEMLNIAYYATMTLPLFGMLCWVFRGLLRRITRTQKCRV